MKGDAGIITRCLAGSFGVKVLCLWLAAALLAFCLGAVTAPFLGSGSLEQAGGMQGHALAQGLRLGNEQSSRIIEDVSAATRAMEDSSPKLSDLDGMREAVIQEVSPKLNKLKDVAAAPAWTPLPAERSSCDLFVGQWVPDEEGPLYQHDSCSVLSGPQNCQANGRPDKGYENWKWQPRDCGIPRFDARAFLKLMAGKTLAFVGDSVARNQMESLMCILLQVETPKNQGFKKMQRWLFRQYSVTVIRIWSSWLVHASYEAVDFAPEGVTKLHLQQVDENFDDFLPRFDVLVISAGHWFTKQAAFVMDGAVVGGQLWKPDSSHNMTYNSVRAFAVAMRTALNRIISHPLYKGITILRTYSPDHYEGGEWNTGGSCTGKVTPLQPGEVYVSNYTATMRQRQLDAYKEATEIGISNGSKLRLMDITPVFDYRADGHPGPYRNQDPNKKTTRGPNGQPPPQDCLHWCMPGPIDTWNVFLFEMLKQEYL